MTLTKTLKYYYRKKKDSVWLLAIIVVLFLVYAYATGPERYAESSVSYNTYEMAEADYGREFSMSSGMAASKSFAAPMIAPSPYPQDEAGRFDDVEQRIRKTAYVTIEVETQYYDTVKNGIDNIIDSNDGFYTSKNEHKNRYRDSEYRTYTISFKVPKDGFESALNQVKKLGNLLNLNVNAQDLTTQYVDAEAYLESYKKEKSRVEELLERAENIEEIMQVESKLTQLQRQIDSYQRQLTNIERQTDYSQITLTLEEEKPVVDEIYQMTPFKEHFKNVIRSLDGLFVLISDLLVWALAALLGYGLYRGFKALRGR